MSGPRLGPRAPCHPQPPTHIKGLTEGLMAPKDRVRDRDPRWAEGGAVATPGKSSRTNTRACASRRPDRAQDEPHKERAPQGRRLPGQAGPGSAPAGQAAQDTPREMDGTHSVLSHFSCVRFCDIKDRSPPGSSVHGISPQEYWSELPFPSLAGLPDPGFKPTSLVSPAV